MTVWKTIDSAPKDGTHIIGADSNGDGSWTMTVVVWNDDGDGYWGLVEVGRHAEDGEWWPEYWAELPPPPDNTDV